MGRHVRSLVVGVAAGARTSLGFAAASFGSRPPTGCRPLDGLGGRWGRRVTVLMVVAELVVDKLPQTPSRLLARGLVPRVTSGTVGAAALAYDDDQGWLPAAALGAAGALAGSWAGFQWRAAAKRRGAPDLPVALAEDAVALSCAALAAGRTFPGDDQALAARVHNALTSPGEQFAGEGRFANCGGWPSKAATAATPGVR